MPREPKLQIFRATNGKWYGHRKAANGKITAATQGYTRRASVEKWAATNFPNVRIEEAAFAPKSPTGGYERPEGMAEVIAASLVKALDANPTLRVAQVLDLLAVNVAEYDEDVAVKLAQIRSARP